MASVDSGSAVILLICVLNIASFMLLADACERTGTFSYLELGANAFGGPRCGVPRRASSPPLAPWK